MRCKNCGWVNPDNQSICEKCHSQLIEVDSNNTSLVSDRMKSTIAENVVFAESPQSPPQRTCPKCGYPVSLSSTSCPNCDHEFQSEPTIKQNITCKKCGANVPSDSKFCSCCGAPINEVTPNNRHIERANLGTIIGGPIMNPNYTNKFCTLKPIAWSGEDVNYNPITYSGDTIILNRANTDPNNNSITSREQAIITCDNGDWYIENKSDLKTTFLRVNGKIKLTNGDIIVLGNREFEFKGQ